MHSRPSDSTLRTATVLFLITALAAGLRLFHLDFKSLWFDEAMIYLIARGDLRHVLEANASLNSAPPFFALLIHSVMRVGTSEQALRAVSCAAGIAAVPATYLLARRFVPRQPACLAALLVAVAPNQIRYAQQLREYALTFLLATLLLWSFTKLRSHPDWRHTLLCSGLAVLALFTQYGLAILILTVAGLFLLAALARGDLRRTAAPWTIVLLFTALAGAAVYHLALRDQLVIARGASYLAEGYWNGTPASLPVLALSGSLGVLDFAFPTPLLWLACALGIAAAVADPDARPALWLFLAPMGAIFLLATLRLYPYVGARQTIFLTPMVYVLAALGFEYLRRSNALLVGGLLVVLMTVCGLRDAARYHRGTGPEHMRPIVDEVYRRAGSADNIYVYASAAPAFRYYSRNETRPWIHAARDPDTGRFEELDRLIDDSRPLWLVVAHRPQERKDVVSYVRAKRPLELVRREDGAWLYLAP